jgi:hypothetical protein
VRVRFTPRDDSSFWQHWLTFGEPIPQQRHGFDNEQRTFCVGLSSFLHQVGKPRSFRDSPIEKSSCHLTDFSTVSRTNRYGSSPSGMVRSYLKNPVHDCMN